jgi:hypothetical protein
MEEGTTPWAERVLQQFAALNEPTQARLLVQWLHNLTVVARGYYPPVGDTPAPEVATVLMAFNEVQHSIINHLRRLLHADDVYPPTEFFSLVLGRADELGCASDVAQALGWAIDAVSSDGF